MADNEALYEKLARYFTAKQIKMIEYVAKGYTKTNIKQILHCRHSYINETLEKLRKLLLEIEDIKEVLNINKYYTSKKEKATVKQIREAMQEI